MHTVLMTAVPPYQQSHLLPLPWLITFSIFLLFLLVCIIWTEFFSAVARDFEETTNDEEASHRR